MATRLYPVTGSPGITPAVASGWENTIAGFTRYPATTVAADYTATTDAGAGSGVANEDTVTAQLVFGPITGATITGNVKGQFGAREANAAVDARAQCTIRVIAPDGTTVRGTLLAMDTAVLSSEFVVDATLPRNIKIPRGGSTALTSTVAQDGDYIVIEIGFRNHGTNTSNTRVRAPGGDASLGDLPENETQTPVTDYRAWVEFSQTIAPYTAPSASAATSTGLANNAKLTIAPTAEVATAIGAAYDATVSYLTPPRTMTINGIDYTDKIRLDSFMFTESANRGEVGVGGFQLDDSALSVTIPAMKAFAFEDPAAGASNKAVFYGYTHDRRTERGPNKVAGQRQWGVEVVDLNTLVDDYVLTNAESADRPAETDFVRVAWLLTSRLNSVANVGVGIVPNTNTVNMDAMDYRGRTARDVLNECSEMAGKNWFIYLYTGTQPLLFYDVTSGSNLTSTSKISDVATDVDSSTTWAVIGPPVVHKSPDEIYSTVHLTYNGGTVSVTNATTASTYRTREIPVTDMSVDTSAKATAKANAFLAASASEKTRVDSVSVRVPAANVNDFRAGQRFQLKLARHDITSFTYYRILRREIRPLNDVSYLVTLTLADQVLPTNYTNQRGGDVYGIWEKKSNATDDGATVIVDRSGVNIIDGAITVVNSSATVVIDGESNMFKIAATGTISATALANNVSGNTVTLSALGTLAAAPVMIGTAGFSNLSTDEQYLSAFITSGAARRFVATSSGGSPTTSITAVQSLVVGDIKLVADEATVHILVLNYGGGSSFDGYLQYYVLQETAF